MSKNAKTQKENGLKTGWFASVWRRKFLIAFLSLVVMAALSLLSLTGALSQATGSIRLDFESAHDGLTPNGTRFNIYDIKNEALLTKALELTGLADALDWRTLSELLSVAPSRTQSVSKRYIATEYTVTLNESPDFGSVRATSLLDVIYRLYYQEFLRQSGMNHSTLSVDWSALADMEYIEAIEAIKTRTDILRQFLQNRIDESDGYESDALASSFRALLTTVETFQSVYIDKYTALITQSHLFRDADDYRAKLTYQRMLTDQTYQLSRAQFAIREQTLKDYEESLIAIVMVPTYYKDTGLYMSRTQIGIDTLTKEAESYSAISQRQALKLARIDSSLDSLAYARHASDDEIATILATITGQFDKLAEAIQSADEDYISYTARDYVCFIPDTPGLTEAYGLKNALLGACLFAICLGTLFFLLDTRGVRAGSGKGRRAGK